MTDYVTINGRQIIDRDGETPFIPRGYCVGHFDLERVGPSSFTDIDDGLDMGSNTIRYVVRWWGDYVYDLAHGFQKDWYSASSFAPGHLDSAHVAALVARLTYARSQGLKTLVALDSNYGQGASGSSSGSGDDFWDAPSSIGSIMRSRFVAMAQWLADNYGDLIDFMEPLVEPGGNNITPSTAEIQDLQEEVMDAVLGVQPQMLFIIGGLNYFHGNMTAAYRTSGGAHSGWGTYYKNKIILTCDYFKGIINAPANWPLAVGHANTARSTHTVPVAIQQVGLETSEGIDEADSVAKLDTFLDLLDAPYDDDPIGYWVWEQTSVYDGGFGWWKLGINSISGDPDPTLGHVSKPLRRSMVAGHFV